MRRIVIRRRASLTLSLFVFQLGLVFNVMPSVALAAEGPPPASVVIAVAEDRELAPTAWYTGSVVSRNDARVPAEVEGRLVSVAEVGELVKKGDILARMDDALARLKMDENKASVARVKARVQFLERESDRLQRLAKKNATARNLLDETQSDRDRESSDLMAAESRFHQAKLRLDRSTVRAPFPGVVTERIARAGEWVDSGDPVVRLVDPSAVEIKASIPLFVISNISVGSKVSVEGRIKTVEARVRTIVPVGDALSRMVDVRLDFSGTVWSHGQVVRVAVPTALPNRVVAVPRDALVIRRTGATVFRVGDDDRAERVSVVTGVAEGPWIEVKGDIKPGDRVIVRGGERMRPKQKVKVISVVDNL